MTREQVDLRYSFDPEHDKLGVGAFGVVYKAYDNVVHLYKAIKIADVKKINNKEYSLLTEFQNVKNIPPQANIAKYEAVYRFKTKYGIIDYAIIQYYEDGSLKDVLKNVDLNINQKKSLIHGILIGLDHLHKANVIHRDLKSGKMLITKDQKGDFIPKISDFGLSKIIDATYEEAFSNSLQGGTIDYTAPEQLMGLKIMQNADIWSFGILILEILTGVKPFEDTESSLSADLKRHTTLLRVFKGNISSALELCSYPYKDIILLCLQIDSYKRIQSVEEAEWEFYALSNKKTVYAGGDDIDNYAINGTRKGTSKVKSKTPNAFGLYDMTGNVAEWCADFYHKDAYVKYKGMLATEPSKNRSRVIRG